MDGGGGGGGHRHCQTCYSFTRCTRDEDSCEFVDCAACGAVFHGCKVDEHLLLCPGARVPCLNAGYGCPMEMARKDTAPHLESCPASVVMCMAEWNRWPVYTSERRKSVPFRQRNPYASEGQLDYDLTLRDERMLNSIGKISRKTRRTLRNNLTRRHPAVPLPQSAAVQREEVEDDGQDDKVLDLGDNIEFSGIRHDKRLSKQMKQWKDDLDERLKGKERPPRYWEFPELEKGGVHKHCAHCVTLDCGDSATNVNNACDTVPCRWRCGSRLHSCKLFEHQMICPLYQEPDDFAWMYRGMEAAAARAKQTAKVANAVKKKAEALKPSEDLFVGPGEPAHRRVRRSKSGGALVPVPPPMPPAIQTVCRLDARLETVTRLQTKPRAMYTFVCAQEFRRDEFAWHSKNVHDDIHGGMNNWMEHRCPLASYGCGFSARRMAPHDAHHAVAFNRTVESFAVVSLRPPLLPVVGNKAEDGLLSLADLPIEILMVVVGKLDSLSLCNFSLTCVHFREICCSLLDTRGCVAFQWERVKTKENKYSWEIAYKRWFFSSAMEPIRRWKMTSDDEAVSGHLKTCPYNVRLKPRPLKERAEGDAQWDRVIESYKGNSRLKRLLINYY